MLSVRDLPGSLLRAAVDVQRPCRVTEVALELADDRRDGERAECEPTVWVEPLHRLDQAEARDLDEVLVRLTGLDVPARKLARQRQEPLDQLISCLAVAMPPPAHE